MENIYQHTEWSLMVVQLNEVLSTGVSTTYPYSQAFYTSSLWSLLICKKVGRPGECYRDLQHSWCHGF